MRTPSFQDGYARGPGESAYPALWDGLLLLVAPSLGVQRAAVNGGFPLYDFSGRDTTGTLSDAVPDSSWQTSPGGWCYTFASTANSISFGSASVFDDLPAFTFAARIHYTTDQVQEKALIAKANDFELTKVLGVGDSFPSHQIIGRVATSTTSAISRSSGAVFSVGSVHHAAMTYNDNGDRIAHLYVDGKEITYGTQTAATGTMTTEASAPLRLAGRGNGTISSPFIGGVLHAAVYGRVLTQGEIELLARVPLAPLVRRRRRLYAPEEVGGGNRRRRVIMSRPA